MFKHGDILVWTIAGPEPIPVGGNTIGVSGTDEFIFEEYTEPDEFGIVWCYLMGYDNELYYFEPACYFWYKGRKVLLETVFEHGV